MSGTAARRVVVVVEDLFFATRIAATAARIGVAVEAVPAARALEACRAGADLVIVDLHGPGDPLGLLRALEADPATREVPVLGFHAHVDRELAAAAAAAGADRVLPRSAFTVKLVEILKGDA